MTRIRRAANKDTRRSSAANGRGMNVKSARNESEPTDT